jgi:hypothetical protein
VVEKIIIQLGQGYFCIQGESEDEYSLGCPPA